MSSFLKSFSSLMFRSYRRLFIGTFIYHFICQIYLYRSYHPRPSPPIARAVYGSFHVGETPLILISARSIKGTSRGGVALGSYHAVDIQQFNCNCKRAIRHTVTSAHPLLHGVYRVYVRAPLQARIPAQASRSISSDFTCDGLDIRWRLR